MEAKARVFCPTLEEVRAIDARALSDVQPHTADLIYIHGHVICNQYVVHKMGAELAARYPDAWLGIVGIDVDDPELPGYTRELENMIKLGVDKNRIVGLVAKTKIPPSTDWESYAIVQNAKKLEYENVVIVSAAFHQVRALLSDVSAVLKTASKLRIFSAVARTDSWTERRRNLQNTPPASWLEELNSTEWEKLKRYYEKGDHCSFAEVLEYLNLRDRHS